MMRVIIGLAAILLASMTAGSELQSEMQVDEAMLHFSGIVLAVDTSRGLVTVEEASVEGLERDFVVLKDTDIQKNGVSIPLGSIASGEPVSIEYETTARGNEARSVKLITVPAT